MFRSVFVVSLKEQLPYIFYRGTFVLKKEGNGRLTVLIRNKSPKSPIHNPFSGDCYDITKQGPIKINLTALTTNLAVGSSLEVHEINRVYLDILKKLDGEVQAVGFSDVHGAANKLFAALTLFPKAKVFTTGDFFDRADNQAGTTNLILTYEDLGEQNGYGPRTGLANPDDFSAVMGNHDAMIIGGGCGELTSAAHSLRFLLRYNEAEYLTKICGLDLTRLKELALKRRYKGNYKASDPTTPPGQPDMNLLLEGLATDLQLKRTYGDKNILLSESERRVLKALKFKGAERELQTAEEINIYKRLRAYDFLEKSDQALVKAYLKAGKDAKKAQLNDEQEARAKELLAQLALTPEEVAYVERLKKGDNEFSEEEMSVLRDLQRQMLKSPEFRKNVLFFLRNFKLYRVIEAGGRKIFLTHAGIPLNKDGSFRKVMNKSGIELLQFLQGELDEVLAAFEKMDPNNDASIDEYLKFIEKKGNLFDFLAWDPDSPLYLRVMKTWERAYLHESSATYDEPEDQWYKMVQNKKADPAFAKRVVDNLAQQLGVDPSDFLIINGHKPSKDGRIEVLGDSRIIKIDAGSSKSYEDMGVVVLITDKGSVYALSLSENMEKIQKYTLMKVVDGKVVEV